MSQPSTSLTQRRVELLQSIQRLEDLSQSFPSTSGSIPVTRGNPPSPSSSFAARLGLLPPEEQAAWDAEEAERWEQIARDREVAERWVATMVEEREGEFFSQEELETIGRADLGRKGKGAARE